MTEAMPFLQKAILLSYDPRPLRRGRLLSYYRLYARSKNVMIRALAQPLPRLKVVPLTSPSSTAHATASA